MGGAWESLIKSVKHALKVITLDRVFINKALYTFLCETECSINQRPLTAISDDVNDFDTLTPNHFLIGETHPNQSPGEFRSKEINYPKKWRAVQAAADMLWNGWRKEYLLTLTQRRGGLLKERNFKKGDLLLLREKNIPRSHWPIGRVMKIYPGQNCVVRIVKLRTPTNEIIQPAKTLLDGRIKLLIVRMLLSHWGGSVLS